MDEQDIQRQVSRLQNQFSVTMEIDEVPLQLFKRHMIVLIQRAWWLTAALAAILALDWWGLQRIVASSWAIGVAVGALVLSLVLFFLFHLDWRDDALILTNLRLIHVERVFFLFRSQQEIALHDIQNVFFSVKGFTASAFNFGTVQIETAAWLSDLSFGPIRDPKVTQETIFNRVHGIQAESSQRILEQTLRHHLDPAHHPPPELTAGPSIKPGSRRLLPFPPNPNLVGGTFTWYKHDFFLWRVLLGHLFLLAGVIAASLVLRSLNVPFFVWLIWAGCVLLSLLSALVGYQRWAGHYLVLAADKIIEVRRTPWGLLGESRRTGDLSTVRDITYAKPGVLANLLNFGDVTVSYAGGKFNFAGVPRPADVQREISRKQRLLRLQKEQQRRDQFAEAAAIFSKIDEEGSS